MKHGPTNTKALRQLRSALSLNRIQRSIIIGTILGDGCLIRSHSGKGARLQVRHKAAHFEYVKWKYHFFRRWVLSKPRFDHCNNSYVFRTISHPQLNQIRDLFYQDSTKMIPETIENELTDPLSLAVWFMDDGNGDRRGCRLRLSTYAFGVAGNKILQSCLKKNFSLNAKILSDPKGSYLYFPDERAQQLYSIIQPYILSCMRYKVDTVASITP